MGSSANCSPVYPAVSCREVSVSGGLLGLGKGKVLGLLGPVPVLYLEEVCVDPHQENAAEATPFPVLIKSCSALLHRSEPSLILSSRPIFKNYLKHLDNYSLWLQPAWGIRPKESVPFPILILWHYPLQHSYQHSIYHTGSSQSIRTIRHVAVA